jgi:DNA-binding CsgD family transcriptional regulator
MTESHPMDRGAQFSALDGKRAGHCSSAPDDAHFKSLLLRLDAALDVPGFWSAVHSILNEVVTNEIEQGDFNALEIALLNRLHPHIEATLQRLSAPAQVESDSSARSRWSAADGRARNEFTCAVPGSSLHEPFSRLTRAERELIALVGEGLSNKEIAARLCKSVRTVKTQLTSVYKKFGVRSRSRLLALMR